MSEFTHLDTSGRARMVDVGSKSPTRRQARASALIEMNAETLQAVRENAVAKGDVLQVARVAGIMAAKQTASLIPLCHPVGLDAVEVEFDIAECGIRILATAAVHDRTGVEMEALTAAAVAALTIYDMCKSVDRGMTIRNLQLDQKSGGMSGDFARKE
jgi:cyclic pyranopterin phosphate synthase